MVKRLILIVALGAALVACSPTDGGAGSPGTESLAPIESMGTESASPAP